MFVEFRRDAFNIFFGNFLESTYRYTKWSYFFFRKTKTSTPGKRKHIWKREKNTYWNITTFTFQKKKIIKILTIAKRRFSIERNEEKMLQFFFKKKSDFWMDT